MGTVPSFTKIIAKQQLKILMIGLDGAGKTTILYQLKANETVKTIPTIGFNVQTLTYKSLQVTVWDVGGQDKIKVLWKHYYQNTDFLVYVVDASDKQRIEDSSNQLNGMLNQAQLQGVSLLVLANKKDKEGIMTIEQVSQKLGLQKIEGRKWNIIGISAFTGDGLNDGLQWIKQVVLKH